MSTALPFADDVPVGLIDHQHGLQPLRDRRSGRTARSAPDRRPSSPAPAACRTRWAASRRCSPRGGESAAAARPCRPPAPPAAAAADPSSFSSNSASPPAAPLRPADLCAGGVSIAELLCCVRLFSRASYASDVPFELGDFADRCRCFRVGPAAGRRPPAGPASRQPERACPARRRRPAGRRGPGFPACRSRCAAAAGRSTASSTAVSTPRLA